MRRRYGVTLLLLSIIVVPLMGCRTSGGPTADSGEGGAPEAESPPVGVYLATAKTHAIEETVAAQGTLTPAEGASAKVAPVNAGRLVSVTVKEGQFVQAGQVVATLDDRAVQAQARSAAAALRASETQIRQADLNAQATESDQIASVRVARLAVVAARTDRENALQAAQTTLDLARTDLTRTNAGARRQEIAQAEAALKQSTATRDRATTEMERVSFLFDKGVAAKRQVDDARTALAVAENAVETAQEQVNLVREGARVEDKQAAQLRVRQAEELLAQAKRGGDTKVAQAEAALKQAEQAALQVAVRRQEAQVQRDTAAQKQADLAAAQTAAGYSVLRAPLSGFVTRRAQNPGDEADPATPVIEIADTRQLDLVAAIPGTEGAAVRVGMPATITLSDGKGAGITGRVRSVGQVDPQTNLLTVRLSVANPNGRLKAGAFASAKIIIRHEPHAVVVPKGAVLARDDKTVVFVVGADDIAHERPVTVGVETDTLVEIREGVKSGERIVRLGNHELAEGTKVKDAEAPASTSADDAKGAGVAK